MARVSSALIFAVVMTCFAQPLGRNAARGVVRAEVGREGRHTPKADTKRGVVRSVVGPDGKATKYGPNADLHGGDDVGRNTTVGPPVFLYVVMGELASSHLMKTMVTSLRVKGKYMGPIVMVTDRLKCLVQNLGTKLLGDITTPAQTPESAVVFEGVHGPYHMVTVAPPRTAAHKFMGRQYFEQHKGLARVHAAHARLPFKVGTVIVIDEDILVTKAVNSFLLHVAYQKLGAAIFNDRTQTDLAVFADNGGAHVKFHCGLVVSYEGSDDCMKQWVRSDIRLMHGSAVPEAASLGDNGASLLDLANRETSEDSEVEFGGRMSSAADGIGQDAFSSTDCAKSGRVHHLHSRFLSFPTQESIMSSPNTTFIHFTNTRRMKEISLSAVQDFIRNEIGVDSDIMSNDKCVDF